MALVNHTKGEINAKIVYFGPGVSGKGTNLNYIYRKLKPENRGTLKSMNVDNSRMIFFDFTPTGLGKVGAYDLRFHVYSIVGDVKGSTAWKMVLKGADGLVFVADSASERLQANRESLETLREILKGYGTHLAELPGVLQCNKRDSDSALPIKNMEDYLNPGRFPVIAASATKGEGVLESLASLMKKMVAKLRESGLVPEAESPQQAGEEVAEAVPPQEFAAAPAPAAEPELAPTTATATAVEEPCATTPVPAAVAAAGSAPEPVVEICGEPEQLSAGRLRLPLKVRCCGAEKEVPLTITISLGVE